MPLREQKVAMPFLDRLPQLLARLILQGGHQLPLQLGQQRVIDALQYPQVLLDHLEDLPSHRHPFASSQIPRLIVLTSCQT